MKNIFVGNLSFNTTEQDIRSLFEAHGSVDRVNVVTDRDTGQAKGFGFVEMTNDSEGDKAIEALNAQELGGRALTVNEARPKAEGAGGGRGRAIVVEAAVVVEIASATAEAGTNLILTAPIWKYLDRGRECNRS
jgi:cold-inducible RNA-binding protein